MADTETFSRLRTRESAAIESGANASKRFTLHRSDGCVQILSHFPFEPYPWKVVGWLLFCSGPPPRGARAKGSGDGDDLGQSVHLQVAFGSPSGRGHVRQSGGHSRISCSSGLLVRRLRQCSEGRL